MAWKNPILNIFVRAEKLLGFKFATFCPTRLAGYRQTRSFLQ